VTKAKQPALLTGLGKRYSRFPQFHSPGDYYPEEEEKRKKRTFLMW
jgi:hypothetical protein